MAPSFPTPRRLLADRAAVCRLPQLYAWHRPTDEPWCPACSPLTRCSAARWARRRTRYRPEAGRACRGLRGDHAQITNQYSIVEANDAAVWTMPSLCPSSRRTPARRPALGVQYRDQVPTHRPRLVGAARETVGCGRGGRPGSSRGATRSAAVEAVDGRELLDLRAARFVTTFAGAQCSSAAALQPSGIPSSSLTAAPRAPEPSSSRRRPGVARGEEHIGRKRIDRRATDDALAVETVVEHRQPRAPRRATGAPAPRRDGRRTPGVRA